MYSAISKNDIDLSCIKARWTQEEVSSLKSCIAAGCSVEEIAKRLRRTDRSVYSKANQFGFGYKTNKEDGLRYFKPNINHKQRRSKDEIEMMKESKPIPILMKDTGIANIEVDSDIIAKIGKKITEIGHLLIDTGRNTEYDAGGES